MKIHKNMNNSQIADLMEAVAAAYKLRGGANNRFKVIAYERASDAVEHLSSEAKDLWDEGKLEEVSGIGKSIASHLGEIFKTGKSKHFDEVMKGLPPAMFELIKVPGIGAKTAHKFSKELGISDKSPLESLEKAAKEGRIASLEGMGKDSEEAILKGIEELKGRNVRLLLPYAEELANEILEWLKKSPVIKRADPLGSVRRKASTVGDVDIAVASNNPSKAIEHFCKYPKANRVLEKGERTASIILPADRQVDLMVERPESYGALLQHFTGSKHHNIALRKYALKKGMSVSDYGVKVTSNKQQVTRQFNDEESFYKYLGMEWIPPELREDSGEIEAALRQAQGKQGGLPKLVQVTDVKADLQIHSSFDIETSHDLGTSSMEKVVEKAARLGYEYIAFTEHNPSQSGHNKREMIGLLKSKKEIVDKLNKELKNRGNEEQENRKTKKLKNKNTLLKVFNSLEIDILPDGKLSVPDVGMETLDFALVSIHSSFRQNRKKMTDRVLKALEHPKAKVFAHPTARKLNVREGIELDWHKIYDYCKKNDKWLEINADPMRLDLPDFLVREAVKAGVKLTLGTDAHHTDHMDNMKHAVYVARRGWAEKKDIINCLSVKEFEKMLEY